jgi:hypothetical protein
MKNPKHVLIALFAVLAAGIASAQAMSDQSYYGEVGYTSLNIKNDDNGFEIKPKLARFIVGKEIDKNLSIEGSYAITASKDSVTLDGEKYTAKATMYGMYLKPKFEIAKDVEAFARIGVIHSKYEDEGSSVSKTNASYGLGIQAQFTKDVYGQLDYMNYYKQDGVTGKGFTVSVGTRF